MKTTLLFLTFILSISLFSQTTSSNIAKKNLDSNGAISENIFSKSAIPSYQSVMSAYLYDTIRPLTEINNPSNADAFPWISPDGLRLYYTGGTNANTNVLMFTQRPNFNSYFIPPVIVPISVSSISSYWLSNNELDIYICGDSVLFAHRNTTTSAFNTTIPISLLQPFGNVSYRDASLNSSQNTLYVSAFSGGYLGIFEFSRTSSTSFTYVRTLPSPSGYTIITGQLSKDELTFFCAAANSTFGKQKLYQLTRSLPTDSFTLGTFQQIQNINDTSVLNIQPSMSDSLNWLAFVRCAQDSWGETDLFIARKEGGITSIFNPEEIKLNMSVFPNPAVSSFTIQFNKSIKNVDLSIHNIQGQKIKTINNITGQSISLHRDNLSSGLYFLQLTKDNKPLCTYKLVLVDN